MHGELVEGAPTPGVPRELPQGIVFGPDIQYDLRGVQEVRCFDSVFDGQRHVPGKPISLLVASQTPLEYFDWLLRPILDFCDQAEAGGFLVFTSRGP